MARRDKITGHHLRTAAGAALAMLTAASAQALYFESISTVSASNQNVTVILPKTGINASDLALIVNDGDPQSVAVARAYRLKRNIPKTNIVHVSFSSGSTDMSIADFNTLKAQVDAALPSSIQGLAISWTSPWRVGCMSMTSAMSLGYDALNCNFNSIQINYPIDAVNPYSTLGFRPAMMLAGLSSQNAIDVIDRGVAADQTLPSGQGYLVRTADFVRSLRYPDFIATAANWNRSNAVGISYVDYSAGGTLANTSNVFLYMTGLVSVPQIETNQYLPGALADHLTSCGGQLTDDSCGQMSILRWLEAGVTASYGTVVEPTANENKFPMASRLVPAYFSGFTALESYWKSVFQPGEGIFVGEPLARPFMTSVHLENNTLTIRTPVLVPGRSYDLAAADSSSGPFVSVQSGISVSTPSVVTLTQSPANHAYYKLYASTVILSGTLTLTGTALSTSSIRWSWNDVPDEINGLRVVTAAGANLSGDLPPHTTTWLQTGLTTNTRYVDYSVVAFTAGLASTSAPISVYTLASAPGLPMITATSDSSVSIGWTYGGNPAGTVYTAQISKSPTFEIVAQSTQMVSFGASFTGLDSETTYYMRIRAVNGDGIATSFTNSVSTRTSKGNGLGAPSHLAGTPMQTSVTWVWTDNSSNETGFRVVDDTGTNASGDLPANTTSWLQINLTANVRVGPYSIVAFNSSGTSISSVPVSIFTLAAVPGAPSIIAASSTTISVTWLSSGNPAGTLFTAQISTHPLFAIVTQSTQTLTLAASFTSLTPATTYFVRVRAENGDAIVTAYTAVAITRTAPVSVPAAPSDLTVTPTDTSATWNWTDNSSNETGLRVVNASGANVSGDLPANTTSWLQSGLTPNVHVGPYYVVAFNSAGASISSVPVSLFTLAVVPGLPNVTAASTTIAVSWLSAGNPDGTLYTAQISRTPAFQKATQSTQTFATAVLFPDLIPATTYYVRVRAENGNSVATAFSAVVAVRTIPMPIPDAPSGLAVTPSITSLSWSWADNSFNESGFRVVSATGANVSGDLPANTTSWLQAGLTANVLVGPYSIVAFNAGGAAASVPLSVYTLAVVPSSPSITTVSSTTIAATWPSGGNPGGTLYTAQISRSLAFLKATQSTQTTALGVTFSGLIPETTYYLRVSAENGNAITTAYSGVVAMRTNPPAFTSVINPASSGAVDLITAYGTHRIEIQPGVFNVPVTVTIENPLTIPADKAPVGALTTPVAVQIAAFDDLANHVRPTHDFTIRLSYQGASLGAYAESQLVIAWFDAAHNAWVPLPSTRDAVNKTVSANSDQPAVFQIMGVAASGDLSQISVGPNPLRPGLNPGQMMSFRNCPAQARVRIFTPRGDLLREVYADSAGLAVWDGRNRFGRPAASGIYVVSVESAGSQKTLHVAIER